MGIFGAPTTAVGGLRAIIRTENISGNIANSQTTAFSHRHHFLDAHSATGRQLSSAGSVTTTPKTTPCRAMFQSAVRATYLAINAPILLGADAGDLSRRPCRCSTRRPLQQQNPRGDVLSRQSGFLATAPSTLEGVPIDPSTGNLTGSSPRF